MKKFVYLCSVLLCFVVIGCLSIKNKHKENIIEADMSNYFTEYSGCFVLFDQNNNTYTISDKEKVNIRLSPCSTFKVVNSLIGLETGVIKDETMVFQWDGTDYRNKNWNQDQTLDSSIKYSTFWFFQRSSAEVGTNRIQHYLNEINYGNKDISGGITVFWEQSSLKISPLEQVKVLRDIYNYNGPFSKRNIDILKKILILSEENGVILSGKTGSGYGGNGIFLPDDPNEGIITGWFIGYLEKDKNVYYFATHIEGEKNAMGMKAREITLKILEDKGIY